MDVGKAQNGVGLQTLTGTEDRDQAQKNAVNSLQARYGEKPKEARAIKKQLDKDDFMRIMITEMKHQDPTKPMDSDRMATQMAQITSVEQLKNVSGAIEKLAEKGSASDRLAMSAMIGKSVTVDKGRFSHQKGTLSALSYDLPVDAAKIKLSVLNEHGEEISSHELDPAKAGPNVYNWDGVNASGIQVASGSYTIRVDAEDAKGAKIKIDPISREAIVGVSFEGGDTNFLVGDPKTPQKVNFRNVVRIEGDEKMKNSVQQTRQQSAQALQAAAAAGSVPANGEFGIPPGLREKMGIVKGAEQGKPVAENSESPARAEGFANGLRE